jgi:predicted nucleic acid-binding protein
MAALVFDTSGIVKRYVLEKGSVWVRAQTAPASGNRVYLARLGAVEVVSAVARRQRAGTIAVAESATILGQFRKDMIAEYSVIEISPGLLSEAMLLAEKHALRANDAVHLAASLEVHRYRQAGGLSGVTLVSSDQELNVAAAAERLSVEDPNLHP